MMIGSIKRCMVLYCVLALSFITAPMAKKVLDVHRVEVNYENSAIYIYGEGFGATPQVILSNALINLTSVSDATITAELPEGIVDGTYQLQVSTDGDFEKDKKLGTISITIAHPSTGGSGGDILPPVIEHNANGSITNLEMPYTFTVSLSDENELAYYAVQQGAQAAKTIYLSPGSKTSNFDISVNLPYTETSVSYLIVAADVAGNINRIPLNVNVEWVYLPPIITSVMPEQIFQLCQGVRYEFEVLATGTDLQYEWYDDFGTTLSYGPKLIIESYDRMSMGIEHCVKVFNQVGEVKVCRDVLDPLGRSCPN